MRGPAAAPRPPVSMARPRRWAFASVGTSPIPDPVGQPPGPCRARRFGLRPGGPAWSYLTSDCGPFAAGPGLPHCAQGPQQRPPLPSPRPLRPRCPVSRPKAVSAGRVPSPARGRKPRRPSPEAWALPPCRVAGESPPFHTPVLLGLGRELGFHFLLSVGSPGRGEEWGRGAGLPWTSGYNREGQLGRRELSSDPWGPPRASASLSSDGGIRSPGLRPWP